MATHYNEKEAADCDFIVRLGKSVDAAQQQISLQNLCIEALQAKIRQYESMTGVLSMKLPEQSKMPDWEYMLKNTTLSKAIES